MEKNFNLITGWPLKCLFGTYSGFGALGKNNTALSVQFLPHDHTLPYLLLAPCSLCALHLVCIPALIGHPGCRGSPGNSWRLSRWKSRPKSQQESRPWICMIPGQDWAARHEQGALLSMVSQGCSLCQSLPSAGSTCWL